MTTIGAEHDLQRDCYAIGDIRIAISARPDVAAALDARLRPLHVPMQEQVQLTFSYLDVPAPGPHAVPAGTGRVVYIPYEGEVLYDSRGDCLSIQLVDRIRARCEGSNGRVTISSRDMTAADVWTLSHLYFTLPLIEMLKRHGLYFLHAAGLLVDGQCVLVTGPSGAGKSTLALRLALAGFGLLGDDTMFLSLTSGELEVIGFPDEIDITERTLTLLPELAAYAPSAKRSGWPKISFRCEALLSGEMVRQGRPSVLIFTRVSGEARSRLTPMRRADAFEALVPHVFLTDRQASQSHLDALAQVVRVCECYELSTGKDLATIPELIRSVVR